MTEYIVKTKSGSFYEVKEHRTGLFKTKYHYEVLAETKHGKNKQYTKPAKILTFLKGESDFLPVNKKNFIEGNKFIFDRPLNRVKTSPIDKIKKAH